MRFAFKKFRGKFGEFSGQFSGKVLRVIQIEIRGDFVTFLIAEGPQGREVSQDELYP